jgi:hypothetical protein
MLGLPLRKESMMPRKKKAPDTWGGLLKREAQEWGQAVHKFGSDWGDSLSDAGTELLTGKPPKNKNGKKTVTIKIVR